MALEDMKYEQQQQQNKPRVILVPFPAQGHVTPMLHLARALHARGFHVTLVCPDYIHRRLAAGDEGIHLASIPSGLCVDGAAADSSSFFGDMPSVVKAMESYMPAHLERWLRLAGGAETTTPSSRLLVIVDLVASWAIPVAEKLGALVAGFWPGMLATYRLVSAIPELMQRGLISECGAPVLRHLLREEEEEQQQSNQEKAAEEIHLPGQAKLSTKHLPWLVGNASSQRLRFKFWLQILDRAKSLPWILVNSFPGESSGPAVDLEHEHDPALQQPPETAPKVFRVGPLMMSCAEDNDAATPRYSLSMWDEDRSCLRWLDGHAPSSVLYVSFGSWVKPIAADKIAELALGLEATRRPFLWVLRDEDSWRSGLPEGFLERVVGHAKVVAWAPQEDVLRHRAVGCYLTHCGWNSTLEGIRHGKRLLCYPVSGDQFVNAAYIVKVWGIGMSPEGTSRKAIGEAVGKIMAGEEGEVVQRRVLELKKRVMGREGSLKAAANLQSFIDNVQKGTEKQEEK